MSAVILKDETRTIIAAADDKRYTITQYPAKGIELSIGTIKSERLSNELEIRLSIPIGTKTQEREAIIEDTPEIVIWPIPLKVLEDIQERTNGDIKIEDLSEYDKKSEPGKEFFIRIKGYFLITVI